MESFYLKFFNTIYGKMVTLFALHFDFLNWKRVFSSYCDIFSVYFKIFSRTKNTCRNNFFLIVELFRHSHVHSNTIFLLMNAAL